MIAFDIGVRVPIAAPAAAMKELDKANPALDQASRGQALLAEDAAFGLIHSVERPRGARFFLQLQGLGDGSLHLKRQLVGLDSGAEVLIIRIIDPCELI